MPDGAGVQDFVEIGIDSETGRKVESLTVVDGHSRFYLGAFVTTSPTTDFVIECLDKVFAAHGVPPMVHSDHGSQWYAVRGGDSRFDAKCEEWGTKHTMAPIRTPECNGKTERVHGSMRAEIKFPEKAAVEDCRAPWRATCATTTRFARIAPWGIAPRRKSSRRLPLSESRYRTSPG